MMLLICQLFIILPIYLAALYFAAVAIIASLLVGQHVVGKIINLVGRASLIIFILTFTIFVTVISLGEHGFGKRNGHNSFQLLQFKCEYDKVKLLATLSFYHEKELSSNKVFCFYLTGGVGISNMIKKIEKKKYMGFENLCKYSAWYGLFLSFPSSDLKPTVLYPCSSGLKPS